MFSRVKTLVLVFFIAFVALVTAHSVVKAQAPTEIPLVVMVTEDGSPVVGELITVTSSTEVITGSTNHQGVWQQSFAPFTTLEIQVRDEVKSRQIPNDSNVIQVTVSFDFETPEPQEKMLLVSAREDSQPVFGEPVTVTTEAGEIINGTTDEYGYWGVLIEVNTLVKVQVRDQIQERNIPNSPDVIQVGVYFNFESPAPEEEQVYTTFLPSILN